MRRRKNLAMKGMLLDANQLEKYMEKIASDHVLQNFSNKDTYPIPAMMQDFEYITKVYHLLNEHIKLRIAIHPAGEWLLDNYYIVEEIVKVIQKDLSPKKYCSFLGIANGEYKGYARAYVLASEMVAYTENRLTQENLIFMLKAYQNKKTLSMDEIWNLGVFLQIALIGHIRRVCEKIYSVQLQKYKVENMVERFIEGKPKEKQIFSMDHKTQELGFGELKYPFIEYMSYRLKKIGRTAYQYIGALEEQVGKMGTTISEVIKKEHFDIALRKVSMGNSITSMKELSRINFLEIFEQINGVEEVLKQDPAEVYSNMDYKTKEEYRSKIQEISKKTKISEIYIAKKLVEVANNKKEELGKENKRAHIGYYLISDGKNELSKILGTKVKGDCNKDIKEKTYRTGILLGSIIFSLFLGWYVYKNVSWKVSILFMILTIIPFSEMIVQVVQYISGKVVKPKLIPKMDFTAGIPKEYATMVIVPTIVNSEKKIKELFTNLEVYYLANKSENIYFTLLGDCTSSDKQIEKSDEEIIRIGKEEAEKLNKKYPSSVPKFHFLYRARKWNSGEKSYLGWERKRGLIHQFNSYMLDNCKQDFLVNTINDAKNGSEENKEVLENIRYVITLDADTELVLNSAFELVGAMAHILNRPVVDEKKNVVVEGHGLIQPMVGVTLDASRKSCFSKMYAGAGGTDSYSNAISNFYQDNFEEGIFSGKGIYDLFVFEQVLSKEIPENTVLSHDLLEGCYLRCGLASDILLMDGYPSKYNSFMTRLHRWIRGDWQITCWIGNNVINKKGEKKKNPLNSLSKFKIFDNLRRSLLEVTIFFILIFSLFILMKNVKIATLGLVISLITLWMPNIIELVNRVIYHKDGQKMQKTFTPIISGLKGNLLRAILNLGFLPHKAYASLNAIIKTCYRKKITHQNLLEWTTAEEAERNAKTDSLSYYLNMIVNVISGIICFLSSIFVSNIVAKTFLFILAILWILMPYIACNLSRDNKLKEKKDQLNKEEKEYLIDIGKKTWKYFKDTLTKENNYLPSDNYQEDRNPLFVNRTSSTNIGLGLLAVISSYDMGYENLKDTATLLEHMIDSITALSKWKGHLYNWYNIKTLEPLKPRYVSTVDSGNFVGYLYVLKQFLIEILDKDEETISKDKLHNMINIIDNLILNTDFSVLYKHDIDLFSIGYNVEENELTDSYYDLLASEARQASLIAISKKDIPAKHWNHLSRTMTSIGGYKGLVSWSGTAFEYLMPNINIKNYEGSLLDESCKFLIMSQQEYTKKLGIPWGISESAFNLKDLNGNYQYKAFGIPWLGLKRGLADEIVVSGYGSMLALPDKPKQVVDNIKRLEKDGIMSKYGILEAIDYTSARLKYGEKKSVVKTFMAHHQGLILLSINNLFNNQILQKRMSLNPEIRAVDILLQERMPENLIITKEKKEKAERLKYNDYEGYTERVYTKLNPYINRSNVSSNENYTIVMNQKGVSYSKYKDIYVSRYKQTDETSQGIQFFFKNIKSKKIWTTGYLPKVAKPDKYIVHYTADNSLIDRNDGNIETKVKTIVSPNDAVEIRALSIKNHGQEEETIEITSYFEPILSNQEQDVSHPAFNKLFLRYEFKEELASLVIERRTREKDGDNIYLGATLYTDQDTIGDLEYEIDKEKFFGREDFFIPDVVKKSKPLSKSIGLVTDPMVAFRRTIRIPAGKEVKLYLILACAEEKQIVEENLKKYRNNQTIEKTFELSKARAMEEARYLGMKGKQIETCQEIASILLFQNSFKYQLFPINTKKQYLQQDLWKFGISGDLPILFVRIQDVNDMYVVEEVLKVYEYLKIKNIQMELVLLDEEAYGYEHYVKDSIQTEILTKQLAYMQNIRGGIFVLSASDITKEDKELLNFSASLILDAHLGNIYSQIEEMEERYLDKIRNIEEENTKTVVFEEEKIRSHQLDKKDTVDNLKYYNEYGAFSNDGKEYIIKVNKDHNIPTVWSHILCNEKFGSVVTEGMGGYTWKDNSRLNRITSWNNNQTQDVPSEVIYFKDKKSNKSWSCGFRPMPDDNDYYVTYGFGYAKYEHTCLGIVQEAEVFVPRKENAKITILHLRNTTPEKRVLKLIYYIKPVLGEDELKTNGKIKVKKENNVVYAKNLYSLEKTNDIAYITSSHEIRSYTGNHNAFIGEGNIQNPDVLKKVLLDNDVGLGADSCIALEMEVELNSFEAKDISLVLGEEENLLDVKNVAYQYSNIPNCVQELQNVKKYWFELLNHMQVTTPVESMNIMLNGWLVYQTICSRLWGKTGYYQSGGAFGFRDQLQDTLGLKYLDANFMKNQVIKHSKHQFIEGDVLHWWHEQTKRGIRTKFSDDLLWLPYATAEYIEFTNNNNILDIKTPYVQGEPLEEGVMEKYEHYPITTKEETIYDHCLKAIDKSLNFGENGLPKIGSGDWNDGFSEVGTKGKGESVWLGFFIYEVLNRWIPIIEKRQGEEKANGYREIQENLRRALNKNGWDGRWYKRAFMDNGEVLGSMENEECRIDNIAQSWSVISGAGDNDKKYISMESLENHLVDKENAIIKLLDPPFSKGKLDPGYIKSYLPGVRENGGQYTHGAIWTIIAESMLGFGDKAGEFFRIINPIEHSRTKESAKKYKVEPYVVAADVYGSENLVGRGGWTWYTGSASWMYKAGIEYILGIKIKGNKLVLDPCIPKQWQEYSVRYRYQDSIYNIKVKNVANKNTLVNRYVINGEEKEGNEIILQNDGRSYEIEAFME